MRSLVSICSVLTLGCVLNVNAALMSNRYIDMLTSENTYKSQLVEALNELKNKGGKWKDIEAIEKFWINTKEPRWMAGDKYCYKRFLNRFKNDLKVINQKLQELEAVRNQGKKEADSKVNSSNKDFEQKINQITINGEKVYCVDNIWTPTNLINFKTANIDNEQWFKDLFSKN